MTPRIFFLTGDRAEYDIQYALLAAAAAAVDFEPGVIVAGSHTAAQYGATAAAVEADGFPIVATLDTLLASDNPLARAKSAAIELASLADCLRNDRPDFLVVMGDREDALMGAIAGTYAEIPVVHLGGGDRGANAHPDNPVRDAVTKLAHLHLAASEESAARIAAMAEETWRIAMIGATGLDRLASTPVLSCGDVFARMGLPAVDGPYLLVTQHVMPSERADAARQMQETIDALVEIGLPTFIGRPNSDSGGAGLRAVIDRAVSEAPLLHFYDNLDRLTFVNLMRGAAAVVGNSSAGLIETPFLKIPCVNIGRRQKGREHSTNLLHVDHDRAEIVQAITRCLHDEAFRAAVAVAESPYGDGQAGPRGLEAIRAVAAERGRLLTKVQHRVAPR